jgi:molecular chaperone HscB
VVQSEKELSITCPGCGVTSDEAHFCPGCGRVKPVTEQTDYFAFFGLPRKLQIDDQELEKGFYSLSRQLHPDFFMNAEADEREASIQRASMLNDAYRTLRDPVMRVKYLLSLEGRIEAEKKAPPDMLEEVFELNMQIDELKEAKKSGDLEMVRTAQAELRGALKALTAKLDYIDSCLKGTFRDWDESESSNEPENRKVVLDRMSDFLSHRAYIRNLIRNIEEEFEEDS